MLRKVAIVLVFASVVLAPHSAEADEPVPRDDADEPDRRLSVVGGSTLEEGERAVVVGYGWPGLHVGGTFALTQRFELGPRAELLQGSPIMGLPFALGFELSVPMRVRLFTRARTDVALSIRPYGLVSRASLVGFEGPGKRGFGYGFGGRGGLRIGHRVHDKISLGWGVLGSLDFIAVPDVNRADLVGTVTGALGIESLLTRATLFFLVAEAGYGFAPDSYFDTHLVLRATVGFAHTQYR
jgi:hypothetical protein